MRESMREGMREGDAVLIAARSGRALAQAARRAGLRPFVLDGFGDEDTLALAEAHAPLPACPGARQGDGAAVLAGLDALAARASHAPLGVVLGSGFEDAPAVIARIAAHHRLLGAGAETVAALKDPFRLADACARLAIPHPAVTRGPVAERGRFLLKRAGGSGGTHIRAATAGPAPPDHYFQERVPGRAYGLTVLADGRDLAVVGLTAQWSAPGRLRPYRFAGAVAPGRDEPSPLSPGLRDAVVAAVARLAAETGLRGLASADILVEGGAWWLLEINPRPGGTLDALDRRGLPLLHAHIEASLGRLPRLDAVPADAAGSEILYLPRRLSPVPVMSWPDFARDRPRPGSAVARDAPFCTVTATGSDAAAVRAALRDRAARLGALADRHEREDRHEYANQASERQRVDGAPRRAAGR